MAQDRHAKIAAADSARVAAGQAVRQLRIECGVKPPLANAVPKLPQVFPENYDRTNLTQVCSCGDLHALQELIAQNADIHAGDDHALQWSAWNNHLELVRLLLDNGANIQARNGYALQTASNQGFFAMVRLLIERGADIHAEDDFALQCAALNGHVEVVRFLLDQGADIQADHNTAIRWAADGGHFDIVDLLVEKGAPVEALSPEVQREAYAAYKQEVNRKVVQTLMEAFKAATWAGHVPEMQKLWSQVPEALQTEFDFSHALTEASQQTLKLRKPKIVITR
jgi:ankyrin repeat protein